MIDNCLYKIEKETPRTREYYTVQGLMLYRYQELALQGFNTKEIVQRVNAVQELRSDLYKFGVRRILRTTRVVRDKIFICIQKICIDSTE